MACSKLPSSSFRHRACAWPRYTYGGSSSSTSSLSSARETGCITSSSSEISKSKSKSMSNPPFSNSMSFEKPGSLFAIASRPAVASSNMVHQAYSSSTTGSAILDYASRSGADQRRRFYSSSSRGRSSILAACPTFTTISTRTSTTMLADRASTPPMGSPQQRRGMMMIREADGGEQNRQSTLRTIRQVLKYAWPKKSPRLQAHLVGSLGCLFLGKAATILAPLALGDLVNSLAKNCSPGGALGPGNASVEVQTASSATQQVQEVAQQLGGNEIAEAADALARTASTPVVGNAIDSIAEISLQSHLEYLPLLWLASYGLARLSAAGFSELRTFLFAPVVQKGCREQALLVFNHLHTLDVEYLTTLKGGEIQQIMNRALKSTQQVLTTILWNVVPTLLEFSLVLGIVFKQMGPASSCVVAATFCSYFAFTTAYSNRRRDFMKESNKREDRLAGHLVDSIVNCEAVRYFSAAQRESQRYDKELAKYEASQVQVLQSLAALNFGQQLVINSGLLAIMTLATYNVMHGLMPVGDVVAVNTLMLQLAQPLNFLGGAYRITLQGVLDLQRMEKFLTDQKPSVPAISSTSALGQKLPNFEYKGGSIEFESVSFRALKNLSLRIPAGSKVGIVGPSGSGKSTILRLLSRVAAPEKGRTLVDGQDLLKLDGESYTSYLGIVPQESILFNESLRFNLEYAKPGCPQHAMKQACSLAQVHDVIEAFPDGYDTMVGERGSRLSGGERQRIAIARCLLKNPQILLFDEATAALDLATEEKLTRAVTDFIREQENKTMLIVAHRLSTVKQCDFILYIDKGAVAEMGSHTELLEKKGGLYRNLWNTYQTGVDPTK
ncbi:unnamed protein product [Amoebophrya sp. A25]|nr:unnamed protein product [Amoebophrya sp. A25]|eukprot:GSA25T00020188001.1